MTGEGYIIGSILSYNEVTEQQVYAYEENVDRDFDRDFFGQLPCQC